MNELSTKPLTLKADLARRTNALACANIVEKTVVDKVEVAIAPLFHKSNNSDDNSFNRCRATYGLEVGRFVNGRILGMKQTRRQVRVENFFVEAAKIERRQVFTPTNTQPSPPPRFPSQTEKSYFEIFVQRSAYEFELMLSDSLLSHTFGGVEPHTQKNKTNDQICTQSNTKSNAVLLSLARRCVLVTAHALVPICCYLRAIVLKFKNEFNASSSPTDLVEKLQWAIKNALKYLTNLNNNSFLYDMTSRIVETCLANLTVGITGSFSTIDSPLAGPSFGFDPYPVEPTYEPGSDLPIIAKEEYWAFATTCQMKNAVLNLFHLLSSFGEKLPKAFSQSSFTKVLEARNKYIERVYDFLLDPNLSETGHFGYCFNCQVMTNNGKDKVNDGRLLTLVGAYVKQVRMWGRGNAHTQLGYFIANTHPSATPFARAALFDC